MLTLQNIDIEINPDLDIFLRNAGFEDEWEDFLEEAVWIAGCSPQVAILMLKLETTLSYWHDNEILINADRHLLEFTDADGKLNPQYVPAWFYETVQERNAQLIEIAETADAIRALLDELLPQPSEDDW